MLELASLMARQARYRPDATAVVFENERLTYRQFWVRVARVGNMLRALGVGPGDKVATVAGNSASLLETYWAVPTIGATLVPLSPLLLATGLASLPHDSDARCSRHRHPCCLCCARRAELPPQCAADRRAPKPAGDATLAATQPGRWCRRR
jgi:acyl-CoA synthetase (AMP-forming)/AMP-acid ligase II